MKRSRKPQSRTKKRHLTRKRSQLTDLPEELIEHISLYLPPTSVRALRCVSKHLREALSSDKVCKRLLYYCERFYKCDMQSGSTAPGVAQVARDLSAGRLRKYQAYEKLQNIRLQLCMDKQFKQCGEIPLQSSFSQAQDMVDDHGQHWVFVRNLGSMSIWNITKQPRLHNVVNFSYMGNMTLLSAGYILLEDSFEIGTVYKFQYPKYRIKEYYTFDSIEDKARPFLSSYVNDCDCDVSGDTIVSCFCVTDNEDNYEDHSNDRFLLHIWRVSDGSKLGEVPLPVYLAGEDQPEPEVFHGYKSNFIIVQGCSSNSGLTVYILNTKARRVTHLVPIKDVESFDRAAYMYNNKVVVLTNGYSQYLIYTLNTECTDSSLAGGRHVKTIETLKEASGQFTGTKLITVNDKGVLIVSLEEDSLPEIQVMCDAKWKLMTFIEPKLLVLAHGDSMTIMSTDGTVLFCGQYEGIGACCRFNGIHRTEYPSKIIIPCKDKIYLLAP